MFAEEITMLVLLKISGGHYESNVARMNILLQSLRHFYDGDLGSTVTILCPDSDQAAVRMEFPGLAVLTDSEVLPGINEIAATNWMKQQFLKLAFSQSCPTRFYLTLDPDNFATRPFGPGALVDNGKGIIDFTTKEDHDYWWVASANMVGLPVIQIPPHVMHVTPCLYAVESVANLAADLAALHGKPWSEILLVDNTKPDEAPGWIENGIYYLNMVRRGDVALYHQTTSPEGMTIRLHNRNEVWVREQLDGWSVEECFGPDSNGIFGVVQSNTYIPPRDVLDRIGKYINERHAFAQNARSKRRMSDIRFLLDLTTSYEYAGKNAVGIVRTEREIGKALLAAQYPVDFFRFDKAASTLLTIPRHEAAAILGENSAEQATKRQPKLTAMSVSPASAKDDDLRLFLKQVRGRLADLSEPSKAVAVLPPGTEEDLEFLDGDVVISAGLLWDGNFMELVYSVKQKIKLSVVQVIYDIVPIHVPEFCVPGMNLRFPKYLLDVAWTADALYCISDCTLRDVDHYLRKHKLPIPALHRIELGVDQAGENQGSLALRNGLNAGDFVVYVSTIEPRKNHAMLFHVWRLLYQTDRESLIPLVIVGRHGWNSSDLINMMKAAEHLYPEYLKLLTEVSDDDLDWLYRNSRFTVYPSIYEGWGLPVAESLARGKFCIAADTSSIPEVAAGFAELIDPLDLVAWTRSIRHYLNAPEDVRAHEAKILQGYKTVSWTTAMGRFVASVTREALPTHTSLPAPAAAGH